MVSQHRTSHIPGAERDLELVPVSRIRHDANDHVPVTVESLGEIAAIPAAPRIRRLIADQRYFGLGARVFHAGAGRMLERVSAHPPGQAQIDLDHLSIDFQLEPAASLGLLRAMLAGGLVVPDGTGYYRPTARFRARAQAPMVAPLSRARARMLIDAVRDSAAQINADWSRNPFEIKLVVVSGSYMSRSDQLPELSLWLILRPRPELQSRRWRPMVSKGAGLRQILTAVSALSSFLVVRIVAHKSVVPRPFCVVFQATEFFELPEISPAQRVRDLGASLGELLSAGSYSSRRRGRPRSDR